MYIIWYFSTKPENIYEQYMIGIIAPLARIMSLLKWTNMQVGGPGAIWNLGMSIVTVYSLP